MKKPISGDARRKSEPREVASEATGPHKLEPFPVVGIGASAGGLEAFSEFLRHLPERSGMAFVLVQHLDPTHISVLQEILSRTTRIPVEEVTDGVIVEPDRVYVISPNTSMAIEGRVLHLAARSLVRGQHMPIDSFFQSLAKDRGDRAIGVILSGTASDGTEGCMAIKAAGGITFAQDEGSAKYSGMPQSAVNAGCIDFVMSPKGIAEELIQISKHPYIARVAAEKEGSLGITQRSGLDELFSLVREATGVDFTHYKQTSLHRRIKRRMVLHKLGKLDDYLTYIKGTPSELDELYKDILIHVTGFFRDAEAYGALRQHVFSNLFRDRKPEDGPVRVWVPGCSTGEEVYSICIILLEYIWEQACNMPISSVAAKEIQVFATDISEASLDRARRGLYSEGVVSGVSEERLKRFFVRTDGGYQIIKPIREMCIFARQNLAKDPPFSNLDLISCRNLLIYLGPVLQQRVIPAMHYGLKPTGYLMLGGSESLGAFSDHFTLIDKKHKIYQKKKTAARLVTAFTGLDYTQRKSEDPRSSKLPETVLTVGKEIERLLVNRYVPASVVVNEQLEIVQFHGRTGAFLEPAPGHPTFSLSRMAREGLLVDLRSALSKAKKDNSTVRKEGVVVTSNGSRRTVDLEVVPLRVQGSSERFFLVVFLDPAQESTVPARKGPRGRKERAKGSPVVRDNERLTREVARLKEQFQSLIEDHETTLEEFKTANEEVLSANEELQSTNEELETAKEELHSSNEELTTLNEELQNRNIELSTANDDLLNLIANVNIPIVMVGSDLRIRRFSPPAEKLLNLIPADVGKYLGEIRPNIDIADLERLVRETIDTASPHEREVHEKGGRWYMLRVRPYKMWDTKIDGAVLSFQDIDALKRTLDQTRNYADALFENAREAILLLDGSLRVISANSAFYHTFQFDEEVGLLHQLGDGQANLARLRALLGEVMQNNSRLDDFELRLSFPHIGERLIILNARRIEPQMGRQLILLAIEDVTENRKQNDALKRQAALLDLAHDAVIVRGLEGTIHFWSRGAEEMYGWKKEEAVGKLQQALLHTRFPKPRKEIDEEMTRAGHWEGELVHLRRDGIARIIQSRWALQKEAGTTLVLELNSDVTEKKLSEGRLRKLSSYLIRVQDEERRRIARELHDSTGQKLAFVKMGLDSLGKQADLERHASALSESVKFIDEAIQEIRTLAQLLHPPLLDEAGLAMATRWLVEGFAKRSGVAVNLVLPPALGRFPENVEIALFRIIQETLNNIHRHSGADKAEIEITETKESVILRVVDNGKGMRSEPSEENPVFGVGIMGMKERLMELGGTLEIASGKKGTTLTATVPNHSELSTSTNF